MRLKTTKELQIGDWILERTGALERKGLKGKFRIARVKEILVDNFEEIDLKKGTIKEIGQKSRNGNTIGAIQGNDGLIRILNNKEIKALQILRTKLKTLNSLEDNKVIEEKKW